MNQALWLKIESFPTDEKSSIRFINLSELGIDAMTSIDELANLKLIPRNGWKFIKNHDLWNPYRIDKKGKTFLRQFGASFALIEKMKQDYVSK